MIISMPMCSARNWRGEMVGYNGPVEIDDADEKAVEWARAWLGMGASLVEDVKSAKAAPKKEPEPVHEPEAEAVQEAVEEAVQTVDYRTAEDLRAELRARGLPTYGSKQDLLDRLASK